MAAVDFPGSIPPPSVNGLAEETVFPQVRTEFESGAVQTRPANFKARQHWALTWNYLEEVHYQTLLAFFRAWQGQLWNWVHPVTDEQFECRFSGDSIKANSPEPGFRNVTIEIEEK